MSKYVPTNNEMYEWTVGRKYRSEFDKKAHAFYNELKEFSLKNNLLEDKFKSERSIKNEFHQFFWELYLAKAFFENGINLSRCTNKKSRIPDFSFEHNGRTIYLETVACGVPTKERNLVTPPSDDFEGGLAPAALIMRGLASSISSKEYDTYKDIIKDDHYIIAVNGLRAINGYPHDQVFEPPFIVQTLFGIGEQYLTNQKNLFQYIEETGKGAPIAQFAKEKNKNITGVLYSIVNIWQNNFPLGYDFIFIQNPYSPDVTDIFNFCKRGLWVREDGNNEWEIINIINAKTA